MTTILRGDDDFDTASPLPAGSFLAKAWVTFEMDGTASIIADGGVSSLTDQGTGNPLFTLDNALVAANGSAWATHALYAGGQEYPIQSGAKINSTNQYEVFCGSDSTNRADWDLGYSGLIR